MNEMKRYIHVSHEQQMQTLSQSSVMPVFLKSKRYCFCKDGLHHWMKITGNDVIGDMIDLPCSNVNCTKIGTTVGNVRLIGSRDKINHYILLCDTCTKISSIIEVRNHTRSAIATISYCVNKPINKESKMIKKESDIIDPYDDFEKIDIDGKCENTP